MPKYRIFTASLALTDPMSYQQAWYRSMAATLLDRQRLIRSQHREQHREFLRSGLDRNDTGLTGSTLMGCISAREERLRSCLSKAVEDVDD